MAVAFNNTGTAVLQAGASFSSAFSVTAGGSNIVAFACVVWDGDATLQSVTAITYGGDTMTSCGSKATFNTAGGLNTQVFYRINPKTGSNTLAITVSGTPTEIYANLVSFTGVHQTTPVRPGTYQNTVSQSTGSNNFFTMTITSNASDLTLSAITDATGGTSTNQTLDGSNTSGVAEMLHDHCTTAASSITDTWTFASSNTDLAMVGFSIQVAAAGGTPVGFYPSYPDMALSPNEVVAN